MKWKLGKTGTISLPDPEIKSTSSTQEKKKKNI